MPEFRFALLELDAFSLALVVLVQPPDPSVSNAAGAVCSAQDKVFRDERSATASVEATTYVIGLDIQLVKKEMQIAPLITHPR